MSGILPPKVEFGRPVHILRGCGGRLALRLDRRVVGLCLVLLALALILTAVSLVSGKFPVPAAEVAHILIGHGSDETRMIVLEWRLPRALLALLLGAALGLSGAIFQSLTRNPLGSPDVIGFAAGAHCGALVVILLGTGGYYQTAAGALAGGIATAVAVYLLAWRQGVQGFRLIVIGIGVAAMLQAFSGWMIRAADLPMAMTAALWGAGSLNGLGIEQLWPLASVLAVVLPLALLTARPMRQMELGEDMARAAGIATDRMRLGLMLIGVALTAAATATAGPIPFIALAAPQIARRLGRVAGTAPASAALTGAVLLLAADQIAQHGLARQLPVGIVTVSIGGLYFLWLLIREGRR